MIDNGIIVKHSSTDVTAIQADMDFNKMDAIFKKQFFGGSSWSLRTRIQIQWNTDQQSQVAMFGFVNLSVTLNHKGQVYINDFSHISPQGMYSRDMQVIVLWMKGRGWKVVKPHPDLVRSSMEMWKHYWQTFLIDSEILDQKYGKRQSGNQFFQQQDTE